MFLLGWLLVSGVTFVVAKETIKDHYVVRIENNVLISVRETVKSSDNLDLSNCGIAHIDRDCFSTVSKIKNLTLSYNHLQTLPIMVFRFLNNLEHLSLSNNKIPNTVAVFGGLSKLKELNMKLNAIKFLMKGSFYGIPVTTNILMDIPVISEKKPRYFEKPFEILSLCLNEKGTVEFLSVYLDNVAQKESSSCKSIIGGLVADTVSFAFEGITGFKAHWYHLKGLPVNSLDFQGNAIEHLTGELLNDLPKNVVKVNLSGNRIRVLKKGVISNMYLRKLDLSENFISVIESSAFVNTNLSELILTDNPLHDEQFRKTMPPGTRVTF